MKAQLKRSAHVPLSRRLLLVLALVMAGTLVVSRALQAPPASSPGEVCRGSGQEGPFTVHLMVVAGARAEVERGIVYDAAYYPLSYPGGDVPAGRGACTDVIIRALRHAGYDLQVLIYEDMKARFYEYPQLWGAPGPDPSIDHRRIPNQVTFLAKYGESLTLETSGQHRAAWQPGDLVYWRFPDGLEHCGVVTNRTGQSGLPMVVHNAGRAVEEDCLTRWEITGHFRYPPK